MLPSKQERTDVEIERMARERRNADMKAAEERAAAHAHQEAIKSWIAKLVEQAHRSVINTIEYGQRNFCYVRIAESYEPLTGENLDVANAVIQELRTPGYTLKLVAEDASYEDHDKDNDGYPSGKAYWVTRWFQSVKITWE